MIWYLNLFENFPQFIVIHTVKGFCIVNKAEVDIFLKFSCFFYDPADVGNLIPLPFLVPLPFLNPACTSGSSQFMSVENESEVTKSCPTLCDSTDCRLPGSFVHGIFQVRTLEWIVISFSRGFS